LSSDELMSCAGGGTNGWVDLRWALSGADVQAP